jgi:hypothetical protein
MKAAAGFGEFLKGFSDFPFNYNENITFAALCSMNMK